MVQMRSLRTANFVSNWRGHVRLCMGGLKLFLFLIEGKKKIKGGKNEQ